MIITEDKNIFFHLLFSRESDAPPPFLDLVDNLNTLVIFKWIKLLSVDVS